MLTLAPSPYAAAYRVALTGDCKEAAMDKTRSQLKQDRGRLDSPFDVSTPLLSTNEVARLLVVHVTTLYCWRYKGAGPRAFKVGKHLRYRLQDVVEWLERSGNGRL